jgi:hypothetical protein
LLFLKPGTGFEAVVKAVFVSIPGRVFATVFLSLVCPAQSLGNVINAYVRVTDQEGMVEGAEKSVICHMHDRVSEILDEHLPAGSKIQQFLMYRMNRQTGCGLQGFISEEVPVVTSIEAVIESLVIRFVKTGHVATV